MRIMLYSNGKITKQVLLVNTVSNTYMKVRHPMYDFDLHATMFNTLEQYIDRLLTLGYSEKFQPMAPPNINR